MPFSFHTLKFTGSNSNRYADGWCASVETDFNVIAQAICMYVWSPCVWVENGIPVVESTRGKKNFYGALYCVLDFDEGLSLDRAKEVFKNYAHIIATTRNHQKEKNKVTCDRFRVVLRFNNFINDVDQYEFNMEFYAGRYRSDPSAVDGGRMFYPCQEVISIADGETLNVFSAPQPPKEYKQKINKVTGEFIQVPTKFETEFDKVGAFVEDHTRNETILKVAQLRAFRHIPIEETIEYCISKTSIKDKAEIIATVKSAYKWAESKKIEDLGPLT